MKIDTKVLPIIQNSAAAKANSVHKDFSVPNTNSSEKAKEAVRPRNSFVTTPMLASEMIALVVVETQEISEAEARVHGKSANSTAHQARAAIEVNPELAGLSFGKVVSQIARDLPLSGLSPAPEEILPEAIPEEVEELEDAEQPVMVDTVLSEEITSAENEEEFTTNLELSVPIIETSLAEELLQQVGNN